MNLLLGFALTVGVPALLEASLQGFMFVYSDLGYTMAMSGVVAFVWIIRTALAYFALRTTSTPASRLVSVPMSEPLKL